MFYIYFNMFSLKNITTYIPGWLLTTAIVFFIFFIVFFVPYWIFDAIYSNKIYPGVQINNIDLEGKTQNEAENLINGLVDKIEENGIIFDIDGHKATIYPIITSSEGDLAYNIMSFDANNTANEAYSFGRSADLAKNIKSIIASFFKKTQIPLSYLIDEEKIKKTLQENFSQYEIPAQNANLIFKNGEFSISEEKLGKIIDYDKAVNALRANLSKPDNSPIKILTITDYPAIAKKNCLNIEAKAKRISTQDSFALVYIASSSPSSATSTLKWEISKEIIAGWLTLSTRNNDLQEAIIVLDNNKIEDYLEKNIAPKINKEPQDAKFTIKDGRVMEFQSSKNGLELDVETVLAQIENKILNSGEGDIELAVKEIESKIASDNVNDFGIKEIIGTGQSNFKGSPNNRRHNIKTGANSLNGVLIKPGEEFSLVAALGEIDGKSGYLQELVIKGNKTVPEYGGGLCQIGTTMFRAALATGLPITMRRNHSYRVAYYEPAGTDATIYSPQPDLKFINDTGHYILIQYRLSGDNLYFDFWGTKDNRMVEKTEPTIYNIVKPAPAKIIETVDLPAGQKKCTEKSHNGADAYFNYKVTYPTGEVKEKKFTSHYVPWRAVCLLGVEKLSTATSTDAIKN